MATLQSFYASSAFDPPEYQPSAREIVEDQIPNAMERTLNIIEHMDVHGELVGWDMADLMQYAHKLDALNRSQAREERKQNARQRLCRIIAMQYSRAVLEGDCDECDRLSDALVLATREWCNG